MNAYYYQIKHKIDGDIVLEGIIRNAEDTIYPRQETAIVTLPFECEAHHFKSFEYTLEGWEIELTRDDVKRLRAN